LDNDSCVNWNQYYTSCRAGDKNPFQGAISFDNIGLAWVAIFLVRSGLKFPTVFEIKAIIIFCDHFSCEIIGIFPGEFVVIKDYVPLPCR